MTMRPSALSYQTQPVARPRPAPTLERMPRSPDAVSSALESLLQRYRESVARVARKHGLSDHLLDEAMQELRIRLWRTFPGSEQLAAVSAGYLYRAAVTAALIVLRRRRAKRESGIEMTAQFEDTTPSRQPGPDQALDESELAERLTRAVDELPTARQAVVRLHLRGYHREEIAELLGWSEAKTRNLLYRGLDDLRATLAKHGIGRGIEV
jgi:RNA polymerase sigma-70 factor (ECF subfamily)